MRFLLEDALTYLSDTQQQPFHEFTRHVLATDDLYPATNALKEIKDRDVVDVDADLWFLAYLAFDHVGTACKIVETTGNPWDLAAATAKRGQGKVSVRGNRQRGFLGHRAQFALLALQEIYEGSGSLYENIGAPKTYAECIRAVDDIPLLGRSAALLLARYFGVVDHTAYPYFDDPGFLEGIAFAMGKMNGKNKLLTPNDVTADNIEQLSIDAMLHESSLIPMVKLYRSYRKKGYAPGRNRRFARIQSHRHASTLSACFAQLCSPRRVSHES